MSKCLKIVLAIFLSLVIIAGASVGIITQGFRKWDKLKDNKITNFYYNGKNGVSADAYNDLLSDYDTLDKYYNFLLNDKIYGNLEIRTYDFYSSFRVETEKSSFMLYSISEKTINPFVQNLPRNSARINELKNLFTKSDVYFEYQHFNLYHVFAKNDFKNYNGTSALATFKAKDNVIFGEYFLKEKVTFEIVYSENITSEQKALVEAGIDENTKFNVNFEFDLKQDEYTDFYTINVRLIVEEKMD